MSALDRIQLASFAGFSFPVREYSVKCSARIHEHVYPHSPGAKVEPLGRALYRIHMISPFQDNFPRWPLLWPETLGTLRTLFEGMEAWDLVIPSIGKISARAIDWDIKLDAKNRSGEILDVTFLEEFENDFLVDQLVTTSTSLPTVANQFFFLVQTRITDNLLLGMDELARDLALQQEQSLYDKMQALVNDITTLDDQADLYGALLQQKADDLSKLCGTVDSQAPTMNDPRSNELLNALHEVHAEALRISKDALGKNRRLETFSTPAVMSVTQVAAFIYGSTDRATEILKLNAFADAMAIPANSNVRYYTEVSSVAA